MGGRYKSNAGKGEGGNETAGFSKAREPAVEKLMRELGLEPVIDGRMALGEGTGAVMMLSLLEMAMCVYRKRTLFSDIKVEQYERYS